MITRAELEALIPHRGEMLLLDHVAAYDLEAGTLTASLSVRPEAFFFKGHFPGYPIMPGVLLVEALAQASAALASLYHPAQAMSTAMLFLSIEKAKFLAPVMPGSTLQLDIKLQRRRGAIWRFVGQAKAGDKIVTSATITAILRQRAALQWDNPTMSTLSNIHPTAQVAPGAKLHPSVVVGAYSIIGPEVTVGEGTVIHNHVTIAGNTHVGQHNQIFPYASLGQRTQDLKHQGGPVRVVIGDHNIIREFVTINQGADYSRGETTVGSHNLLMAYVHVAHDCIIGNHCVIANGTQLGGHVVLADHVTMGGLVGVHHYCHIGAHAMVGASSMVNEDVIPFGAVYGNRAMLQGLNWVGLKRRGFAKEDLQALRKTYRQLFYGEGTLAQRLADLQAQPQSNLAVQQLLSFVAASQRGVCLPAGDDQADDDLD